MKTKDRIVDQALALFNEKCTALVSTNHIAEAAGISPGNLYYHFRNKEEIIRAICDRLFTVTATMFAPDPDRPLALADVQRWVRANFLVTWQFAFVYRELPSLLRNDPVLATTYAEVRARGYSGFCDLIAALSAEGVLVPGLDQTTTILLADLLWLLTEQWLTGLELQGLSASEATIQRGIDLMMLVLRPYLA